MDKLLVFLKVNVKCLMIQFWNMTQQVYTRPAVQRSCMQTFYIFTLGAGLPDHLIVQHHGLHILICLDHRLPPVDRNQEDKCRRVLLTSGGIENVLNLKAELSRCGLSELFPPCERNDWLCDRSESASCHSQWGLRQRPSAAESTPHLSSSVLTSSRVSVSRTISEFITSAAMRRTPVIGCLWRTWWTNTNSHNMTPWVSINIICSA